MRLVTRAQWRARYGRGPTNITPERGGVAIHWEGPRMGTFPHSSCDDKVRGIERFHVEVNGWAAIAYTLLVCPHGYVFEGRGLGHRTAANGTNDSNQRYYAVCGLLGKGDPTPAALLAAFSEAVAYLRSHDAGDDVRPHSAFFSTECPGDRLRRWIRDREFERPIEEDPMPDYTRVDGSAPLSLAPGEWRTLTFVGKDGGHWPSFLNGRATFTADLEIRITGLAPGADVQTRAFEIDTQDDDRVVERYPIQEDKGTAGTTYVHYTIGAGLLQAGRKLRVEVTQSGDATAEVTDRRARLHHWAA